MTHPTFRYTTKVYGHTATINGGGFQTESIDAIGMHLIGLKIPAAFCGTKLYVNVSTDGTNFVKAYNPQGVRLAIATVADSYICICPDDFAGVRYFKLESDCQLIENTSIEVYMRVS